MESTDFSIPTQVEIEFDHRNRIRKLAFSGSVVRGEFELHSAISELVEFEISYLRRSVSFLMENKISCLWVQKIN
jgi:predicted nucleotidyltransferase